MKAKPVSILHDIENNSDLVVGKKYNGFSELLIVEGGRVRMFNKSGTDHTDNVPHLTSVKVPSSIDIVLVGEGYASSGRLEDAKSIFGSYAENAIEAQRSKGLANFIAISVNRYNGKDLSIIPFGDRLPALTEAVSSLQSLGISICQETLIKSDKTSYFNSTILSGGEGVVVKSLMGYESDWYKVKKMYTWDVVITGFTMANYGLTGKFDGLIGAIKYGVYDTQGCLKETGKCSGMLDSQRVEFTLNQDYYIGEVIEVKGQEIGNRGAIVFPKFVRVRDDKLPTDCVELV